MLAHWLRHSINEVAWSYLNGDGSCPLSRDWHDRVEYAPFCSVLASTQASSCVKSFGWLFDHVFDTPTTMPSALSARGFGRTTSKLFTSCNNLSAMHTPVTPQAIQPTCTSAHAAAATNLDIGSLVVLDVRRRVGVCSVEGIIEVVVPANTVPTPDQRKAADAYGGPRDHVSYLVRVRPTSGRGKGQLRWPHVAALRAAECQSKQTL